MAFEQIGRDNVKDWLAWGFLNKATWEAIDDDELEEYIVESEILLGRKFLLGRKAAMPMKPILDPVQISHRPLLYYLVSDRIIQGPSRWLTNNQLGVGGSDVLSHLYLLCHTFEYYSPSTYFTSFPFRPLSIVHNNVAPSSHLSYYHRPHTSRSHLPVLFIHGVGILNVYQNLLTELNRASDEYVTDGDIGVIVLEIKSIRFCITRAALSKDEMCAEILTILQMHNWDKFVLMGNSYGTVISAQLLKNADIGPRMGAILFIDPIPFLMHLPELVYNFIYRPHRKASEHQLHYFASTDMGTAHTLMRRMFWSESILWKEDIEGRKITIILSEKDIIVDAEAVGRYLTRARGVRAMDDHRSDQWKRWAWKGEGMDVLWFKGLNHAEVFDTKADRETLIRVLMDYCKRGD